MIKEALEYLTNIGGAQTEIKPIKIEGRWYTKEHLVEQTPRTSHTLRASTLTGLIDFIADLKEHDVSDMFIRIISPTQVFVEKRLDDNKHHELLLSSDIRDLFSENIKFKMCNYYPAEELIPYLKSNFIPTEHLSSILEILSNVTSEQVLTSQDDGISQSVTVKRGLKSSVKIPSYVVLKPYRTFFEIEQPESTFILRAKNGGENQPPEFALFEADGGMWKITAIEKIKLYLLERLKGEFGIVIPIIA